jgi:hypothetical protein
VRAAVLAPVLYVALANVFNISCVGSMFFFASNSQKTKRARTIASSVQICDHACVQETTIHIKNSGRKKSMCVLDLRGIASLSDVPCTLFSQLSSDRRTRAAHAIGLGDAV